MDDEQAYRDELSTDAQIIWDEAERAVKAGEITTSDELEESIDDAVGDTANGHVNYTHRCKQVIRWSGNLDEIEDVVGIDDLGNATSASDALCRIARWAYRRDLYDQIFDRYDVNELIDDEDEPVIKRSPKRRSLGRRKSPKKNPKRGAEILRKYLSI